MADKTDNIKTRLSFDGEKEYKENCAQIGQNLKVLSSELKVATAQYASNGNSVDALRAKQDVLKKTYDEQKKKVEETEKAYKAMVDAQGENSAGAKRMETALNNAKAAMYNTENQVKTLGEQLNNAGKSSSNFGEKLKSGLSGLGNGVATGVKAAGAAIVGMGTAAAGAAAGAFKLAEKASELNEAQNVVDATFKTSSKSILDWSNTVSASSGIGKTAATQMVGSMGAMLKSSGMTEQSSGSMSKSLVQLSGDLASFYNLDNNTAWEKIRSGISGETEPLKQLGINMSVANLQAYAMSQGIKKNYTEMSQAEQTQLRYNYLMNVTKDAQGDFVKTSGGMANQQRILQMNFENLSQSVGSMFLPMANDAVKSVNEVVTALNGAVSSGQGFDKLGNVVGKALSELLGKITGALPGVTQMATSILSRVVGSLVQAIPSILGTLTNGVVALINAAIKILQDNGPQLINAGVQAITTLISGIIGALPQILAAGITLVTTLIDSISGQLPALIPMAVNVIMTLVNGLYTNLPKVIESGLKMLLSLVQGLMSALPQLIAWVPQIVITMVNYIVKALPMLIEMAPKIIVSIITGIIGALPQLIAAVPQIIISIISGLITALPTLLTMGPMMLSEIWDGLKSQDWGKIGGDIIKGIADGFTTAWKYVSDAVSNIGNKIKNGFQSFFGIHSPSTLMRDQVGKFIGLGISEGIQQTNFMANIPSMIARTKGQINNALTGITGSVDASSSRGVTQGSTYSQTVIINSPKALTPSETARLTRNATRQLVLRARA